MSTTSGGSKPMPHLSPDFMPLLSPTRMDEGRERQKKVLLRLQTVSTHHTEQTRYAVGTVTADVLARYGKTWNMEMWKVMNWTLLIVQIHFDNFSFIS